MKSSASLRAPLQGAGSLSWGNEAGEKWRQTILLEAVRGSLQGDTGQTWEKQSIFQRAGKGGRRKGKVREREGKVREREG